MKRCWHILINKFYLPAALFNLNNYKHIIVLHYFIPLFIHINDVMKAHIAKHNCNYVDMYYFLFFFLFNPMIKGFCNRDNSTVLHVALPYLLQHRLMWWVCSKFRCNYSDYPAIYLKVSSQLKRRQCPRLIFFLLQQKSCCRNQLSILALLS